MSELLTISRLSQRTGTPRTTIHFYLREGLLPPPLKTGPNRALYTDEHVRLLARIKERRNGGLSLGEIRKELAAELAAYERDRHDLVAQEHERLRGTILRVATQEFLERGYKQVRVADVIRKAGINTKTFYKIFTSKAELLVEVFRTFVTWHVAFTEKRVADLDPGERLLWRAHANKKTREFSSTLLALAASETLNDDEFNRRIQEAHAPIIEKTVQEFEAALRPGVKPPVPFELLAYSLIGAYNHSLLRVSLDGRYSEEDVLATHLWLFLNVLDALRNQNEPDLHLTRYKKLIAEIAARKPESPPALPG